MTLYLIWLLTYFDSFPGFDTTISCPFPWCDFFLNLTWLNIGFHGTSTTVWHANKGRLLLRTPGPVPFGPCMCSTCWDQSFSWTCIFSWLFSSNIPWYFLNFAPFAPVYSELGVKTGKFTYVKRWTKAVEILNKTHFARVYTDFNDRTDFDFHRIERFPWSIGDGCGRPAGSTYPSGHLVPSPFLGFACAPIPDSSNLSCLYSTFHIEYPLVLSRFCSHTFHSRLAGLSSILNLNFRSRPWVHVIATRNVMVGSFKSCKLTTLVSIITSAHRPKSVRYRCVSKLLMLSFCDCFHHYINFILIQGITS